MTRYVGGAALLLALFLGGSVWLALAFLSPTRTLPNLKLTTLDGGTEQLTGIHDVPTVVYLWTTDCGLCGGEFELLAGAARSARYGGFRYLFVNQGNDEAAVRRYLESSGLSAVAASVYLDPTSSAYDALEASRLPASYFFQQNGSLHEARGVIRRPELLIYTLEPLLGQRAR